MSRLADAIRRRNMEALRRQVYRPGPAVTPVTVRPCNGRLGFFPVPSQVAP